jgi:predicted MPP superfamily phosphohydrolase
MILNTLIVLVTGFFTLIKWRILPFVETLFALYGVSGIVLAITHFGVGKQRSWKFRLVWLGTVAGLLFIFVVIMLSWVGVVYLPNIFDAGIYSYIGTFFVLPGLLTVSGIWKICRRRARKSQKVHRKPHQRSGEVLVNLCCSLAMLSLGSYSAFIEPNMLRVERIDIVSDKVSEEVTILHLTDMHITQIGTHEQKIFQRIQELQPDMIVRTGDFLDVYDTEEKRQILQELAAIFRQFAPKYGHYAVLGNHDEWHMDAKAFAWFDELSGTKTLINDKHAFPTPAGQFLVIGLWPSTSRVVTKADFDEWWQEVAKDDFTILLWHYPDYILQAAHLSIDLCLAGHLHGGGQVRLPFIGAIPVVYEALVHHVDSDFPRKWTAGYHEVGNTRIHVGIGTGGTHVRFNCPPTITLFTLRPEV